ncbi:MAG: flagellar protein [Oligoflexia bacterium]|nr:flagellar protein [Oligoflexia bacterium]
MIDKVFIPNVSSTTAGNASVDRLNGAVRPDKTGSKPFEDFLQEAVGANELKFSSHALHRLNSRNIMLGNNDVQRLSNAVEKAVSKGGKDTLVLMDRTGFIVDARTKTVVTALDLNSMKEQVFTNIDTTVLG